MIDPTILITYVAIVFGFVFIPGPATLLTATQAASSGTKVGIATGVGIAAGDVVHTIMAIVGISALIAASALLFSVIKFVGAGYLVYLGIRAIFDKTPENLVKSELPVSAGNAFRRAIITEVLNPKAALFFLTFLPQFVQPDHGPAFLQLATLGTVFVLLGFFSTVIYAASAARLGNFLRRNPTVLKWQGKVVGTIYCALGVRLALERH